MKTMRERFDDTFYEEVNSFMGTAFGDSELDAKLKNFIEQELKKEREEIVEMIELMITNNTRGIPFPTVEESVARGIINTIKNRV